MIRELLRRRLFTGNEVFQSVLLHVRTLCERASGSADGIGVDENAIIMIKYDLSKTHTLEEFKSVQMIQIDEALLKLQLLKEEVIQLTYISCLVSNTSLFLNFLYKN